jgi:hypothetical protein
MGAAPQAEGGTWGAQPAALRWDQSRSVPEDSSHSGVFVTCVTIHELGFMDWLPVTHECVVLVGVVRDRRPVTHLIGRPLANHVSMNVLRFLPSNPFPSSAAHCKRNVFQLYVARVESHFPAVHVGLNAVTLLVKVPVDPDCGPCWDGLRFAHEMRLPASSCNHNVEGGVVSPHPPQLRHMPGYLTFSGPNSATMASKQFRRAT